MKKTSSPCGRSPPFTTSCVRHSRAANLRRPAVRARAINRGGDPRKRSRPRSARLSRPSSFPRRARRTGHNRRDSTKEEVSMTTELVLLGTAGAPMPVVGRGGISSALIVDERVFVIDCGRGSPSAFVEAGLDFTRLEAVLLTHLHVDHTGDLVGMLLYPWGVRTGDHGPLAPIRVYGPSRSPSSKMTWFGSRPSPLRTAGRFPLSPTVSTRRTAPSSSRATPPSTTT
jgi:hypothetical protein